MKRWPLRVLAVFLFVWEPMRVATELLSSMSTLGMRGGVAVSELLAHAIVAVIAVAAARALWADAAHGPTLATVALIGSAAVSVQTLHASALPQQSAPGQQLPFTVLAVVHSASWIAYLSRVRRS